ncbi:MAG: 30S ribosomal protein S16 [Rhodopirellula sp.]|nr:30S ribosomal protein S16 [Rhodopirellula sp.]
MAVRIRLKRMGRTHRPFYRISAMDSRSPRNGKDIERLGYYDPMVSEKDARVKLNNERIAYWLSVGAKPTEKVKVLIDKYGPEGTHLEAQAEAFARLQANKPMAPPPEALPSFDEPEPEAVTEETAEATEAPAEEAVTEEAAEATEAPAEEAVTEEATEAPAEEAAAEEAPTEEAESPAEEAEAPAEAEAEAAETSAEEAADEEASE